MTSAYWEFSGSDWFGQVFRDGSHRWAFAVAFSFDGEHLVTNCTANYGSAAAAERGLRALVGIMYEERLKVWAAAGGGVPVV